MSAYYNENNPCAASALRQMIRDGVIAHGVVDDRSIEDVKPNDLQRFTQAHFFAGSGAWSVAARQAGWSDDRRLWTASCPCQPFSVAGKGGGTDDARHLWPHLFRLVRAVRPPVLVGEQVAGTAGYGWFDGVAADLEGEGYACRAVDIPALGVNAPHQRNRLYWVAMGDAAGSSGAGEREREAHLRKARGGKHRGSDGGYMGDAAPPILGQPGSIGGRKSALGGSGFWRGAEWIQCHDGKARRSKPDLRDVAHGISGTDDPILAHGGYNLLVEPYKGRAEAWKLAGNAVVVPLAAEVLAALLDTLA